MQITKIRARALVVGAALATSATLVSACSGATQMSGSLAPDSRETQSAPAPVAGSWVLFQQDAGARQEVAMISFDGAEQVAPLHDVGTGHQTNPDWSPDGARVVFVMSDGERDDLWVADTDGGNATMLLDCSGTCRWLDDPDWSPDGHEIVYSRSIQRSDGWGISSLETVDVATGEVRVVLGPWRRFFSAGARYSPDGGHIVFEKVLKAGRGLDSDIRSVGLSVTRANGPGRMDRWLTDARLFAATADWSPDGRRIVYSALAKPTGDAPDLFWIRATGGEPNRITSLADQGGFAAEPAWLPDSSGVLFSGHLEQGSGSPELLRVDVDGNGLGAAFAGATIFGRHPRVQPAH